MYDTELDDHVKGKERLIFPKLDKVKWWHEAFNRTDEEMNGPKNAVTERYLGNGDESFGSNRTVLTGVETAHASTGVAQPAPSSNPFTQEHSDTEPANARQLSNESPGAFASLRDGIAGLGIGRGRGTSGGSKSPASGKQPMEVEMQ